MTVGWIFRCKRCESVKADIFWFGSVRHPFRYFHLSFLHSELQYQSSSSPPFSPFRPHSRSASLGPCVSLYWELSTRSHADASSSWRSRPPLAALRFVLVRRQRFRSGSSPILCLATHRLSRSRRCICVQLLQAARLLSVSRHSLPSSLLQLVWHAAPRPTRICTSLLLVSRSFRLRKRSLLGAGSQEGRRRQGHQACLLRSRQEVPSGYQQGERLQGTLRRDPERLRPTQRREEARRLRPVRHHRWPARLRPVRRWRLVPLRCRRIRRIPRLWRLLQRRQCGLHL